MRRYVETFFRYWLIAVVPLIALPAADLALYRAAPKTVVASANIWVNQSAVDQSSDPSTQWMTQAQIEANTLSEFLQSPTFDLSVARSSSAYRQALAKQSNAMGTAGSDLVKNVQISAKGQHLVNVSYTSKNWLLAQQVVTAFLDQARGQLQRLNNQQSKADIAYYSYQLRNARARLGQSTAALTQYAADKHIALSQVLLQQTADPTLAGLYQQYQSDEQAVANAQQKIVDLSAANGPFASTVGPGSFSVVDAASVSVVSSKKSLLLNLGIGVVLGLLVSVGFVVVKTALDRAVRYPDEVPQLLDLPVLAVVPYNAALGARRRDASPSAVTPMPRRRATGL